MSTVENEVIATREEVDELINAWKRDPCWDLAEDLDAKFMPYQKELRQIAAQYDLDDLLRSMKRELFDYQQAVKSLHKRKLGSIVRLRSASFLCVPGGWVCVHKECRDQANLEETAVATSVAVTSCFVPDSLEFKPECDHEYLIDMDGPHGDDIARPTGTATCGKCGHVYHFESF